MSTYAPMAQHPCPPVAVGEFKQQLYSQLKAAGLMSSLKVGDCSIVAPCKTAHTAPSSAHDCLML